jgi:acyl carrier protein
MDIEREVLRALDEVLSLGGRTSSFTHATHLLGAVPELDSMAVVGLITSLEERFGIAIDDDDIDGQTFATVGSLTAFVGGKIAPPVSR